MRSNKVVPCLLAAALAGCAETPPCAVDPPTAEELRVNGACLIMAEDRVLTIRHRRSGKYDLPGGRRLATETAQCTAHRETWEETGLEVIVGRRVSTGVGSAIYECRVRQQVGEDIPVPLSGILEVTAVQWVAPAELESDDWRFQTTPEAVRSFLQR